MYVSIILFALLKSSLHCAGITSNNVSIVNLSVNLVYAPSNVGSTVIVFTVLSILSGVTHSVKVASSIVIFIGFNLAQVTESYPL